MNDQVEVTYTNHRGETAKRRLLPIKMWFGCTAWHPTAQHFLKAFCLDRQETRDFAMSGFGGDWKVLEKQ